MQRLTFWTVRSHDLCDHVHLWFRAAPKVRHYELMKILHAQGHMV